MPPTRDATTGVCFHIASDTDREFGRVIAVAKAAEIFDLVDTPKRMVVLSTDGRTFVAANAQKRRELWREKLLAQRLFRDVRALLERQPDKELDGELVQELIILNMPREDYEETFQTFLRWARFGELFHFNEQTGRLSLPPPETA